MTQLEVFDPPMCCTSGVCGPEVDPLLAAFAADIQIFQQLPIYLRQRVLKEGKVLCCKDQDALYNIALRTVQAFADFKPLYDRYLDEVARDRP